VSSRATPSGSSQTKHRNTKNRDRVRKKRANTLRHCNTTQCPVTTPFYAQCSAPKRVWGRIERKEEYHCKETMGERAEGAHADCSLIGKSKHNQWAVYIETEGNT